MSDLFYHTRLSCELGRLIHEHKEDVKSVKLMWVAPDDAKKDFMYLNGRNGVYGNVFVKKDGLCGICGEIDPRRDKTQLETTKPISASRHDPYEGTKRKGEWDKSEFEKCRKRRRTETEEEDPKEWNGTPAVFLDSTDSCGTSGTISPANQLVENTQR